MCVEIGNPLLTLLRDSKVAQGIPDIRPNLLPEEIWIVSSEIFDAISVSDRSGCLREFHRPTVGDRNRAEMPTAKPSARRPAPVARG